MEKTVKNILYDLEHRPCHNVCLQKKEIKRWFRLPIKVLKIVLMFITDVPIGGLAAKVARRDTMAMRLTNQIQRTDSTTNSTDSSTASSMSEDEKSALKVNLTR